jgi:hypothetical protein
MLRERETANMSVGMARFVRRTAVIAHVAGASTLALVAFAGTAVGASGTTGPSGPTGPTGPTGTSGATLKITIKPLPVHPKQRYVVTISGSFQPSQVSGGAGYLVDFLQYTAAPCKATAQAEESLPVRERTFDYAGAERRSPFKRSQPWIAGNRIGTRHACAYLYAHAIRPKSTTRPIAKADKRYRDV